MRNDEGFNDNQKSVDCHYGLLELPAYQAIDIHAKQQIDETMAYDPTKPLKWGATPDFPKPPAIGTRVFINFNQFGHGSVLAYFTEYGWIGAMVKLEVQPEWHKKQGNEPNALVFGIEIKLPQST
jgi:hypothetical protein